MSTFSPKIRSNPSILVKIYDAIQSCIAVGQQSTYPAIISFLDKGLKQIDIEQTFRYAIEEGLLQSVSDVFNVTPFEKSPIRVRTHDSFCHTCHGSGLVLECETCWRVSHASCCPVDAPTNKGKFICTMCKRMRTTKFSPLEPKKLNRLLIFIIVILRERFKEHGLSPEKFSNPVYKTLMYRYVGFDSVEENISRNFYKTPLDFLSDIQAMFHCFVLASGQELSVMADMLYNYCHYELDELEICPSCYLLSNTTPENWFSIPCTPSHRLVYAKQKGYSWWPAKIIRPLTASGEDFDGENSDDAAQFDVRYFGGNHERAFIEAEFMKPIETDIQKLVPKRTGAFSKAFDELKICLDYMKDVSKFEQIFNSLWTITDWRKEIENQKLKKAEEVQSKYNSKQKKGRSKSISTQSMRSTPTPTNSNSNISNENELSRDASVSEVTSVIEEAPIPSKKVPNSAKRQKEPTKSRVRKSATVAEALPEPLPVARKIPAKVEEPHSPDLVKPSKKQKLDSPPSKPKGPCPLDSVCGEAFERKIEELKQQYEEQIRLLIEKYESEKKIETANFEKKLQEEINKFQKQTTEEIASVKRKQWCVNCSQEAFFPCCWNTAYCSQHCQQEHWYSEHKRLCRRRRTPQEQKPGNDSTNEVKMAVTSPNGNCK